ncbi:hypothetical protein SASPL_107401 [Salvia splendens]|uniref:HORMA domain-containing protein n=1 Tax=Salvia splendens TaxID=180675 RepID=A0A8X8YES9_SALSN|nr:hypothetical protein SASPL_107401 [Salvia splendens]
MVVAQKVKESEITEQDSFLLVNLSLMLDLVFSVRCSVVFTLKDKVDMIILKIASGFDQTRNLLRIAIFNISYIRCLFPEKDFNDKSVPALDMKIKKLMPMDAESRRLIDWMEKGVYDALLKKYLKTLLFCVCEAVDGPMIEEYSFSFSYSSSDSQEVSMNISRSGTKKGGTFKHDSTTEITPSQMRSSGCKMVCTLMQLMRTLDKMPEERTVLMKLLYYDDVTVGQPPFFRGCTDEELCNPWMKDPLKMEVGKVNRKQLVLTLKVKSVLDPCEDENIDNQDEVISFGADSLQKDEDSESDSEDPAEDEQQLGRVKEWIGSYHLETVDLTDVLSNFPDISVVLIEDIMDKLVKETFVTKAAGDNYEFDAVKEEVDVQVGGYNGKAGSVDHIYMKALYHTLPMRYITIAKLQNKLEGEASQGMVRKLLDRMANDGYVEATSNRRLGGKRVIQSDLTKKKIIEVKKILSFDAMEGDNKKSGKANNLETETAGSKYKDLSTCGGLHSIGSDITRTRGRSDANMNDSTRTENGLGRKLGRSGNTPTSRAEPAASKESFVAGADDDMDLVMESRCTQEKRFRKTSTVKEPIQQYAKRQKSVAI